jgi:hypothetical protein
VTGFFICGSGVSLLTNADTDKKPTKCEAFSCKVLGKPLVEV